MALQFKDESVKELIASGKPVVIDFWAEWCGPCRMVAPIIDELAVEFEGRAAIGKYNVDEENDLSAEYGIRNIPTILFFKDGKLVDKQVGAAPKAAIQAKVEAIAE
ncbi:MAG: thioredoxin [Bacteroidales bacterium]